MEVLMAVLFGVVGGVAIVALGSILNGWALSMLWKWFMVPIFGLPSLTIIQAIGISLIVGFLTRHLISTSDVSDDEETKKKKMQNSLITISLSPFIFLLVGWIVHCFMPN